jgi:hypothetical protein
MKVILQRITKIISCQFRRKLDRFIGAKIRDIERLVPFYRVKLIKKQEVV